MAGHSKWANIQHRKGKQDKARSAMFSKLAKEITVAAKMGMPDPDMNPRLRLAVKAAKSQSMPKDVIDRAIKKSQMGDAADYTEIRYEGYGAGGIAIIVEALTDNLNRTASNVRSYFSKFGGNLGQTGSVSHSFDRVGEISYPVAAGDGRVYATLQGYSDDAQLFALRTSDGATLWSRAFENRPKVNPPSHVNGRVYFQTRFGRCDRPTLGVSLCLQEFKKTPVASAHSLQFQGFGIPIEMAGRYGPGRLGTVICTARLHLVAHSMVNRMASATSLRVFRLFIAMRWILRKASCSDIPCSISMPLAFSMIFRDSRVSLSFATSLRKLVTSIK